jgi:REP-associated tyrosine transposase
MPRHARLFIPGVPLHIRQRAINQSPCFGAEADYRLYLGLMAELSPRLACSVHAYVLMTNHVHLLMTAPQPELASCFMKMLAQRYAQHFNRKSRRCGPLWEGRFRSSPVDSERYLLTCYRYIELNPVRACMVSSPGDYPWSSFHTNAMGVPSLFLNPHPEYLRLGATTSERKAAYRGMLMAGLSTSELAAIRGAINANAALGDEGYVAGIEARLGRTARPIPRGRPATRISSDRKKSLSPV